MILPDERSETETSSKEEYTRFLGAREMTSLLVYFRVTTEAVKFFFRRNKNFTM